MKVQIQQTSLQKVLRVVQKNVSNKPQLPILSCILLTAKNNTLTLAATDLYTGVTVEVEATIKQEGSFAVPGKYFSQIISSLNDPTIGIEVVENVLVVKTKETTSKLVGMNAKDFPDFPSLKEKGKALPVEKFYSSLQRVVFSASSDQTRPILTGVLLSPEEETICLVATDGFRLSLEKLSLSLGISDEVLLPAKSLLDVFKTAEEEGVEEVQFAYSNELKQARIEVDNYVFYIRLLDGEYPPYQKIIPTQISTIVHCNRHDLEEKLQQSLIFNQDNSFITQCIITKNAVELFASSPSAGENRSSLVNPEVKGELVTIAFNTRYVLDFLKAVSDEWVTIEIVESLRPARLKCRSLPDYQYVVMPFRVTT